MSDQSIAARWRVVREERRTALIPYLTAGYPDRATSLAALRLVAAEGADIVEIGVPFSDPLADGPVIQRSSQIALSGGMTALGVLRLIDEARLDRPVVVFSYLNPILAYGLPAFVRDAKAAGASGLLITDLPSGEDQSIEQTVRQGGLDLIRLVAPTSDAERIARVAAGASGFLYLISRLGVTGPATTLDQTVAEMVARVRQATDLPVALGFGVATPDQARVAGRLADGVVVGSALVERLGSGLDVTRDLMIELRSALDERF